MGAVGAWWRAAAPSVPQPGSLCGRAGVCSTLSTQEPAMTVCPIAIVAGCKKCPAYSVCPLKTVLGDAPKPGAPKPDAKPKK
jgi:hypothetical protein